MHFPCFPSFYLGNYLWGWASCSLHSNCSLDCKTISLEVGFHYHSTQSTYANLASALLFPIPFDDNWHPYPILCAVRMPVFYGVVMKIPHGTTQSFPNTALATANYAVHEIH